MPDDADRAGARRGWAATRGTSRSSSRSCTGGWRRSPRLEKELREQKESLAAHEKSVAQQWAERESAKLKELERRCDLVLEKFEAQARETIEKIVAGARTARRPRPAMRQVGKLKRELREEIETTVLSTADESRQGELARAEDQRGRPGPAQGRARARAGAPDAGGRPDRGGGGFPEATGPGGRGPGGSARGARASRPKHVSFDAAPLSTGAVLEINLIGQRAEEAREQVEKFLDNATLADVARVRIVHGHGMGILRRAVAELLAKHPNVEKFYPAEQNEGGTGATIVELKG